MDAFSENKVVGSISGKLHDISGPTIVPGQISGAIHISGENQWVNFGSFPKECLGSFDYCPYGFSMSFWIKVGNKTSDKSMNILTSGGINDRYAVALSNLDGNLKLRCRFKSLVWKGDSVYAFKTFVWEFMTFTWHADYGVDMYVQGILITQIPKGMPDKSIPKNPKYSGVEINDFLLGAGSARFTVSRMGQFTMDQLSIYNSRLTPHEVQVLFKTRKK